MQRPARAVLALAVVATAMSLPAEEIAPGAEGRNALGLNRRGGLIADFSNDLVQGRSESKFGKGDINFFSHKRPCRSEA